MTDYTRLKNATAELDAAVAELTASVTPSPPPVPSAGELTDLPASVQPYLIGAWAGPVFEKPNVTIEAGGKVNVFSVGTVRASTAPETPIVRFGNNDIWFSVYGRGQQAQFELTNRLTQFATYAYLDVGRRALVEVSTDPGMNGVTTYVDAVNVNNHVTLWPDLPALTGLVAQDVGAYAAEWTVVTRPMPATARSDLRNYLAAKAGLSLTPVPQPGPGPDNPPPPPPPVPESGAFLQLTSPVLTGKSTANQYGSPQGYVVSVDPATWQIAPGTYTFRGLAVGLRNVAVIDPMGGWHTIVQTGTSFDEVTGEFVIANVPIPDENGPCAVNVYAWDSPPGDGNYHVAMTLRAELFVVGGSDARPPKSPPAGLPSMSLVFEDDFTGPLSASSASNANTKWWQGSKPSIWEEGSGGEYQDAYFVHSDDALGRNPFTVLPDGNGYLRIRATYDPYLQDPRGWSRTFWGGGLSTGFPDGHASVAYRRGYAEMRAALATGGSAWNSFWLVDQESIIEANKAKGAVEIDIVEQYGQHPTAIQNALHNWPGGNAANGPDIHNANWLEVGNPDVGAQMHTYGLQLTNTEIVYFFDRREVWRQPLPRDKGPFYLMVHGSLGGGVWPTIVHPSHTYDMWVDYVRVWIHD